MDRPSPFVHRLAALLVLIAALAGAGCSSAHYLINAPLPGDAGPGYALRHLDAGDNSDSLLVMLTLSGGGYRAAALAHAVMAELAATDVEWQGRRTTLLREVDVISAVSGGSLAAAYYAAYPQRFLEEFPEQVLAWDLQSALMQRVLSPSGLWRQTSSHFGRSDLLQELLDERVFHGLRYADLQRRRPIVYVNATDMRHGRRFEFSQDQFDQLCSDLEPFPLARAVAASMAVPVLMSAVTVWNYSADCPLDRSPPMMARRSGWGRYVHLLDGGLADNTGVSALLERIAANGGLLSTARAARLLGVRKRVFIIVNAQVQPDEPEDHLPHTPSLLRQLRSVVSVPIDRHADANVQLLANAAHRWQDELRQADDPAVRASADAFHLIEINMANAGDHAMAAALKDVPTGLRMNASHLALIRRFVQSELAGHPQWQRLVRDLSG